MMPHAIRTTHTRVAVDIFPRAGSSSQPDEPANVEPRDVGGDVDAPYDEDQQGGFLGLLPLTERVPAALFGSEAMFLPQRVFDSCASGPAEGVDYRRPSPRLGFSEEARTGVSTAEFYEKLYPLGDEEIPLACTFHVFTFHITSLASSSNNNGGWLAWLAADGPGSRGNITEP